MNNSRAIEMYPYTYVNRGKKTVLIWQTNELSGDSFKVDENEKLLFAKSKQEYLKILGDDFDKVHWSEGAEIDFDKFWISLNNLRVERASSSKTCDRLLNGWNFIEDMLKTFNLKSDFDQLKTPMLNKAYKKLFSGNNLPAVTPEDKTYSPVWTKKEIKNIRSAFRSVWRSLKRHGLIIPGTSGEHRGRP